MLEVKNIRKIYNPGTVQEKCLFDDFSLSIPDGQFVSVVGSNGSGEPAQPDLRQHPAGRRANPHAGARYPQGQ